MFDTIIHKVEPTNHSCYCEPCFFHRHRYCEIEKELAYWKMRFLEKENYKYASISENQWKALEAGLNVPIFVNESLGDPFKTIVIKKA